MAAGAAVGTELPQGLADGTFVVGIGLAQAHAKSRLAKARSTRVICRETLSLGFLFRDWPLGGS